MELGYTRRSNRLLAIQLLIRIFFSYKTFPKIWGFYVYKSLTMFIIAQYSFFQSIFYRHIYNVFKCRITPKGGGGGGRGEGNSIVLHLSFLTHSACQYDVT